MSAFTLRTRGVIFVVLRLVLAGLVCLISPSILHAANSTFPPTYTVTEVYTKPLDVASMNASGVVAGLTGKNFAAKRTSVVVENGVVTDITSAVGDNALCTSINDEGTIGGTLDKKSSATPFVFFDGAVHELEMPKNKGVYVDGLNDLGVASGEVTFETSTGVFHQDAYLWPGFGEPIDLGLAEGDAPAFPAVDGSEVYQHQRFRRKHVGYANFYACYWKAGLGFNLPDAHGDSFSYGYADDINIVGEISGRTDTQDAGGLATFWDRSHVATLIPLLNPTYLDSSAEALNDYGDVVGELLMGRTLPEYHAFIYHKGKSYDLNTLIPKDSKIVLTDGQQINDRGQILCAGVKKGNISTPLLYLLTPVEEKE